ncbi:hypothetical protein Poly51_01340 [Rubripirellula tenax]|uniref:Uncharacterized protein n=1 Tax=Rubripirellula tenax TaxID=2528015 RepID=A0A5C6FEF2_9BACT|nr:hypothetical protein Poly51_01340 [Rubripirellula tenax]
MSSHGLIIDLLVRVSRKLYVRTWQQWPIEVLQSEQRRFDEHTDWPNDFPSKLASRDTHFHKGAIGHIGGLQGVARSTSRGLAVKLIC